jgi:DNA-binding NtrC family response regulator
MNIPVVAVVDTEEPQCRELCALLEEAGIQAVALVALEGLRQRLKKEQVGVLIVDLDTLPVDNNFFKSLKKQNPRLHILCLSSLTYHPGLKEAMGSYIYASLAKPLNTEELLYWLKAIAEIGPGEAHNC